jgi:predicted enzyme related to lactoylglutathione lyase
VADADAAVAHFARHGAAVRSPVRDVGGGIRVATVADPFGNLVGLIENPHFSAA